MEAIDDYANEHLARSLAYTVLELRQQHHFMTLIPMASQALKQRIRYLQPSTQSDADEWNKIIQWQTDGCPEQIEHLWQHEPIKPATTVEEQHQQHATLHDDVYQNPVYYKRFDADTLHVVIPFNQKDDQIYLVILVLEQEQQEQDDSGTGAPLDDGTTEEPELKYQNTKQVSLQEWQDIQSTWSSSLEDAERLFLIKVTKNAKHTRKESKSKQVEESNKDAPDDYWGDWSSDDEERNGAIGDGKGTHKGHVGGNTADADDDDEQLDSEDDYYARWSENPGTLTPGIDENGNPIDDDDSISLSSDHRRLSGTLAQQQDQRSTRQLKSDIQQEWDEEYDQSYNPLFTVPSVPNLVDAHTSALQELTQMLQTSLPTPPPTTQHPNPSSTYKRPSLIMSSMDTLPKAVQQRFEWDQDQELDEQELDQETSQHVPGAYPLSRGTQTPIDYSSKPTATSLSIQPTPAASTTTTTETKPAPLPVENTAVSWDDQKRHAGKLLLEKSMRALVGAAKLLGLNADDIGGMVKDILHETEKGGN